MLTVNLVVHRFLTLATCTFQQVLEDVIEYNETPDGRTEKKLDRILLNGSNVCMLVPGSEGPQKEQS